jgi:hypothetical protein
MPLKDSYIQGIRGWVEYDIHCYECDYIYYGAALPEYGRLYLSDNTIDKLDEPCPECGGKMVEYD